MLKTLDGALALLTHFTARQPGWGVRELSRESGVHHAVVQRVLATFAAHGFLVQDDVTGRYSLGLRCYELGQTVRKTFSPAEVVQPALDALARESGETVFLSWLDAHEGLCTDMAHGRHPLRFSIEPGQRFALHAGAHAKAILAFQPESLRRRVAGESNLSPDALETHLGRIRADGWAFTREESTVSVAGLAVPLRSRESRAVIGSLAIAGPLQRLDEQALPRLLDALRSARDKIGPVAGFLR